MPVIASRFHASAATPATTLLRPASPRGDMPIDSALSFSRLIRTMLLALLGIVAVLGAAAPLGAQGATTGAIRGRVADEGGQPLTGATVTAANVATGLSRTVQVDEQGIYTIRLLPPGTYTVTARRIGQQQADLEDIRVIVGSTTPANFTLRAATVTLTGVQVIAAPATADVTDAGVRTTVTREEITSLPTLGRDFTDFIQLSGMVSPNPEETTGGQFSIAGMRPSQTNLQIDGVDANNAYFGENRGSSRIPFAFSLESIQEFQVITNGFDVEYGNYSGGIVNIVTRGGSNDFRGTAYANYRGDAITAQNFDGTPINNFQAQQFAASVEGPLIRDRLFYLFSVDGQRRREPFRPASPANFRQQAAEARAAGEEDDADDLEAAADSMEVYLGILENQYGIENAAAGYKEWEVTQDVLTLFGRLDWNLGDRHRLSLRNNYSTYKNVNEAGSFAIQPGLSASETIRDRANSAVAELTSTLGTNAFNVLRIQHAFEKRPRIPNSRLPQLSVSITSDETIRYSGSGLVFDNSLDESKLQIVDNLTTVAGNHTIKLGTNNTFSWFNNRFWNGGAGQFVFNSLADFEAGRPASYVRNMRADRTPPVARFSAQEWSVYVQDDWQIRPRLLGSFGLRYDVNRYSDRPGRVIDVERAFGFETGTAPIDDDNISPRGALTWDVRGDASEIVRIGAGLFYGRVPYVMGGNVAIADQALLRLECRGSFAEGAPDAPPIPDYANWDSDGSDNPFECLGGPSIQGVPEYSFWSTDFEIPETVKANIGYERALPNLFRGKLDLVVSESRKLYTVRNLNLREPQFALDAEGGRRVFVPEGVFDPSRSAGNERLRNTDFSNLFVNYNDGVARSVAASIEVSRPLGEQASIRGSYTWTRAYDNSSFSCCTSFAGFDDMTVGAEGPNRIGGVGDEEGSWGPSAFVREHTLIFSGYRNDLPWGLRLSAMWRIQSGKPWGPEQSGDLNGDGVSFNDRPYIYRPSELPVFISPSVSDAAVRDSIIGANRATYADHLRRFECVGDHQGQIIPRNTCRQPWFNSLDVSLRKSFPTRAGQSAELQIDLFNVLNGINSDWGRNMDIRSSSRNLLSPQGYDPETGQIQYTVPSTFGRQSIVGTNLIQQFSAQVGVRYRF